MQNDQVYALDFAMHSNLVKNYFEAKMIKSKSSSYL
jgi:hypothetical protein